MNRRGFLRALMSFPFFAAVPFFPKQARAKPVLLLETPVAGFQYYNGENVWDALKVGQPLRLSREPDNPYDRNAIAVYASNGKIGYIPMADNTVIARMMDSKIKIDARIAGLAKSRNPWRRVSVNLEIAQ